MYGYVLSNFYNFFTAYFLYMPIPKQGRLRPNLAKLCFLQSKIAHMIFQTLFWGIYLRLFCQPARLLQTECPSEKVLRKLTEKHRYCHNKYFKCLTNF